MLTAFFAGLLSMGLFLSPGPSSSGSFGPEDMLEIRSFARGSEPVLSPDGKWLAYAVADPSVEENVRASWPSAFLYVVPSAGGEVRRLPDESIHAQSPVWSADGQRLAFFSREGSRVELLFWELASNQIRKSGMAFDTGERFSQQGLPGPLWTPDGRTILVQVPDPRNKSEQPRVQVIQSQDAIVPGDTRFTDTDLWKIVAVDVLSGRTRTLTAESLAVRDVQVSPNGGNLLIQTVTPETLGRFRAEKRELWTVAVDGSAPPNRFSTEESPRWYVFSADGEEVLFPAERRLMARSLKSGKERTVVEQLPPLTQQPRLATATGRLGLLSARAGTGSSDGRMYSILRPQFDVVVIDLKTGNIRTLSSDSRHDEISGFSWSGDGKSLYYRAVDPESYRETIYRWSGDKGPASELGVYDEGLGDFSPSRDGGQLAFTAGSATQPEDAYIIEVGSGRRRRITNLNPQLSAFEFVEPETFDYFSADGDPLKALLYRPATTPAGGAPVVTFVYEKLSPSRTRFNPEAQLHVQKGIAYLMPDVLIKPGYTGESFVKSVVPAVNAVRAMGFTNGRFGITGGSFGGYAGLFLISHSDIFAAAVVRAPPSEFFSTWGDGRDRDIWTIETGQARTGGTPWEVPERYIANSPFFFADRVNTPVLILHGTKDFTVPFQQGEMMFHALRALKKPAELVIYREGDHSIVRGSRADFLDFYQRTLEWWQKYLYQGQAQGSTEASR